MKQVTKTIKVTKGANHYTVTITQSIERRGSCVTCGGKTLRSWRSGLLQRRCFRCRYLVMIYGPGIRVE